MTARSDASDSGNATTPGKLKSPKTKAPKANRIKPPKQPRPHVPVAFAWGLGAAVIGGILTLVPTLIAWAIDSKSSASWNDAFGVGIDMWALAHRAHLSTDGVSVAASPLLLTLLCVLIVRFAAHRAFPVERLSHRDLTIIMGGFGFGYLLGAQLWGVLSAIGPARISWWSLILGPACVCLAGIAWMLWHMRDRSLEVAVAGDLAINAAPLLLRRSVAPAFRGLRWFFVASGLICLGLLAWHGGRVWAIQSHLEPGIAGGLLLVLGQLTMLPNYLIYAATWTVGGTLSVGAVQLHHGSVTVGALPLVPVLGALPDAMWSSWVWLCLLIPICIGGYIGWDASGTVARLASLRTRVVVAATSALVATLVLWLLAWFSTVSVSQGLLTYVGPSWHGWVLVPAELLPSAVAVAAVRHWIINHRH